MVKISEEDRNGGVYARIMCYRMRASRVLMGSLESRDFGGRGT